MHRLWIALVVTMALASIGGAAQADVAGEWEITLNTQVGETTWTATIAQDGNTLSGEIDLGDREIFPLDGTVEGAAIELVFVMPDLDGDQPINLSGVVAGDAIAGDEGNFSWYGAGDWMGSRQHGQ